MRNNILIAVIAIIAITATGSGYYYFVKNTSVGVTVFIDITDSSKIQNYTDEISKLLSDKSKWGEATLHIEPISDFNYNKSYVAKLNSQFILLANPTDRDNELKKFNQQIAEYVQHIIAVDTGRNKSNIYSPIIREANRLSASQAHEKILLVYSDLEENTDSTFSIYSPVDRRLIQTKPEVVRKRLERFGKPGNLTGLKVYFIFGPQTQMDNEYFDLMSSFFGDIFKDAGATVYIGANFPTDK